MREAEGLLNRRLLMVAGMVNPCEKIFDIGTDHCYLPVYLISKGICKKAVATDIKKGPVKIAQRNVRLFDMKKSIDIFISEGISHVDKGSSIVISGMGADVIIDILVKDMEIAKSAAQVIIQCQSRTERLRAFLWDNGFEIKTEALTQDKDKIYNAFLTSYSGITGTYTKIDTIASKHLVEIHHPLLSDYLSGYIKKLDDIISGYMAGGRDFAEETDLKRGLEALYEDI
ncbi:MAG TPA: class I SAM-dependent methyltransferase [Clostridia bacterium]|nr:class I SAM-dependent methyltransferase [Clostridia bacterium]